MASYVIPKLSDFDSDLFSVEIAPGVTLILNIPNLVYRLNGVDVSFNSVNIAVIDATTDDKLYVVCPNVIGFNNKYISVVSEDADLQGVQLTKDNLERCYIEVPDGL